jgi:hypothetical protein
LVLSVEQLVGLSRIRRVLYGDIASMFFQVDVITMFGEPLANDSVRGEAFTRLTSSLDFEAEDHLKTNRDVFMQLDERPAKTYLQPNSPGHK